MNRFKGSPSGDGQTNFVSSLKRLLEMLQQKSNYPITPYEFVNHLRNIFPQFDQKGEGGIHAQQDAEECLSNILDVLRHKVSKIATPEEEEKIVSINNETSIVKQLFGIQVEEKYYKNFPY